MSFDAPEVPQAIPSEPAASPEDDGADPAPTATPALPVVAPTAVPVSENPAAQHEEIAESAPAFDELVKAVWARVDRAVAEGVADRAWIWGPEPLTSPLEEPYEDSPGGDRLVQYFDHARLEITHPSKPSDSAWRLTSGRLVSELMNGRIQVGDGEYIEREPAQLDIVGEGDTASVPNYAALKSLQDVEPLEPGDPIIWRLDGSATVTSEPVLRMRDIDVAVVDDLTNHAIARPFWKYMKASGPVWDGEEYEDGLLFRDPYFATGHPLTEPYWIVQTAGGVSRDVLVQCFERRCLIYGPEQGAEWRVTSSVVGRQYLSWRYDDRDSVASSPLVR